jgi:hypothetical protein
LVSNSSLCRADERRPYSSRYWNGLEHEYVITLLSYIRNRKSSVHASEPINGLRKPQAMCGIFKSLIDSRNFVVLTFDIFHVQLIMVTPTNWYEP